MWGQLLSWGSLLFCVSRALFTSVLMCCGFVPVTSSCNCHFNQDVTHIPTWVNCTSSGLNTCYTTEITNHCYTANITPKSVKLAVLPGRRLLHSCVRALIFLLFVTNDVRILFDYNYHGLHFARYDLDNDTDW